MKIVLWWRLMLPKAPNLPATLKVARSTSALHLTIALTVKQIQPQNKTKTKHFVLYDGTGSKITVFLLLTLLFFLVSVCWDPIFLDQVESRVHENILQYFSWFSCNFPTTLACKYLRYFSICRLLKHPPMAIMLNYKVPPPDAAAFELLFFLSHFKTIILMRTN